MEYSVAQSIDTFSDLYNVPYPNLNGSPSIDHVCPGLGQIVNSNYEVIVPMRARPAHVVEVKGGPDETLVQSTENPKNDILNTQMGSGETPMDTNIFESFQHPIVTDAIIFPKDVAKKHKIDLVNDEVPNKKLKASKAKKVTVHKFSIV